MNRVDWFRAECTEFDVLFHKKNKKEKQKMTSTQYYKQTSDMSYPIDDWRIEGNTFKAVVQLSNGAKPTDILSTNDFFAIKDVDESKKFLSGQEVKFEITFVYNTHHYSVYDIEVCDVIDCRHADGHLVLSCCSFMMLDDVVEKEELKSEPRDTNTNVDAVSPYKAFQSPFGGNFPFDVKFPSFDKMFEDMSKRFDEMKNRGGRFCEVSCSYDNNGNGHYRKVDNDGVVEKHFKKVDGEIKEIEPPSKCNGNCGNCNCGEHHKKAELNDLV